MEKIKLHIGCGTLYKENWINIDNNSDNNIEQLDINHDLSKGLPFDNETIDFIYNEHFIEHLSKDEGLQFLYECHRVLKIGGVIRISCPDLDSIIDGYVNNNWREQSWVKKYNYEWIESDCQMLNLNLNESPWGHKYVYNSKELIISLEKVGFNSNNIKKEFFSHSEYLELQNIDTRVDGMFFDIVKNSKTTRIEKFEILQNISTKFIQLFIENEDGFLEENSIRFPIFENNEIQKFEFDLSKVDNIKNLRLVPVNECCVIEIESIKINEKQELISGIVSNSLLQYERNYIFDTNDSQIYFQNQIEDFRKVEKLVVMIRYIEIGKNILIESIKELKEELGKTKEELGKTKEEFDLILSSLSWKITKPLRKIRNIFKGNK